MKLPTKAQVESMSADLKEMSKETKGLGPPDPEMLTDCGDGVVRPILVYPSPRLRDETADVSEFDDRLRKLVSDLTTTMYTIGGIGLAAPQLGETDRVFVIDLMNGQPPRRDRPPSQLLVVVNPQVWVIPGKSKRDAERCLSFPDVVENVTRPTQIVLKAFDHHGKPYALGCAADLARVIQHENDHLEGVLLIDHMAKKKARDLRRRIQANGRRR